MFDKNVKKFYKKSIFSTENTWGNEIIQRCKKIPYLNI